MNGFNQCTIVIDGVEKVFTCVDSALDFLSNYPLGTSCPLRASLEVVYPEGKATYWFGCHATLVESLMDL
ncbi:hypothetical protein [Photobacterium indicum]|uniref:hypothetical protein n=1 Tax=Photobacterium indicum TaxID=81447 RepID=UPI003D13F7C7